MINGSGVEDGVAKPPARRQVAEWIVGAYKYITQQKARNAWKNMATNGFLLEIIIIVIVIVTFVFFALNVTIY